MEVIRSFSRSLPRVLAAVALACAGVLAVSATPAGATTTTCNGGTVAAGNYGYLVINGFCSLPDSGTVNVSQSVTVGSHGAFNAISLATLNVGGNIYVQSGGALALGCSPEVGCSGSSNDRVGQSIRATNALAVIIHNTTVNGNVALNGGGGGVTCDDNPAVHGPAYFDVEDSTIGQSVSITNLKSCWLGFIRNHVHGNVTIANNTLADSDANEVVTNTIAMSLSCSGNSPAARSGDSGGGTNVVGGTKSGECAGL